MLARFPLTTLALIVGFPSVEGVALAQSTLSGAPPPDEKAIVAAPTAPGSVPADAKPATDGTTASLSAGGQWVTGNSNLLAATVNGTFDTRHGANEFGGGLLGNYGQSTPPGGQWAIETAENIQGKLRYDRYLSAPLAVFFLVTGRQDRFQGLNFRLNLDPGLKYLFVKKSADAVWIEAGYDFQFDDRRSDSLAVTAPTGPASALEPVPVAGCTPTDANYAVDGNIVPCAQAALSKTQIYNSTRLFVGFRHAFNKDVTLGAGVEYLQSIVAVDAGTAGEVYDSRLNFDALFASKISGGLSLGLGIHAAYDRYPLPGKKDLDTASTLSIIYSYSDLPEPPKPPCPCVAPPPPPPPLPVPPPPADAAPPAAPPPPPAAPAPGPATL